MTIDDMTPEQEAAIEALSLTGGGFAEARQGDAVVKTARGSNYLVSVDGDVTRIEQRETTTYRRLMADTYGQGTTA